MFTKELLSELEIVAHRAAEASSSSLTTLLNNHVTVTVNGVNWAGLEDVPETLGGSETHCAGLISRVRGEIEGNAVLLFSEEDSLALTTALGSKVETIEQFGPLERSMLQETANITISSFMNSITAHLGHRCIPNAPMYILDLGGAILEFLLVECAYVSDKVILFSTQFVCKNQNIKASFIFLPSPDSLDIIQEGLDDGD